MLAKPLAAALTPGMRDDESPSASLGQNRDGFSGIASVSVTAAACNASPKNDRVTTPLNNGDPQVDPSG